MESLPPEVNPFPPIVVIEHTVFGGIPPSTAFMPKVPPEHRKRPWKPRVWKRRRRRPGDRNRTRIVHTFVRLSEAELHLARLAAKHAGVHHATLMRSLILDRARRLLEPALNSDQPPE